MGVIAAVVLGALGGAATGASESSMNNAPAPGSVGKQAGGLVGGLSESKATIEPSATAPADSAPVPVSAGPATVDQVEAPDTIKQPDRSRTSFSFPRVQ